jgi:hypothetical protein
MFRTLLGGPKFKALVTKRNKYASHKHSSRNNYGPNLNGIGLRPLTICSLELIYLFNLLDLKQQYASHVKSTPSSQSEYGNTGRSWT